MTSSITPARTATGARSRAAGGRTFRRLPLTADTGHGLVQDAPGTGRPHGEQVWAGLRGYTG
ncbi:hypothetical protein [Streptomyces sp. NPDC058294]|uniref:hypothetical protein n=1 Tax=Streptomyces sp. NPDC058294 TaxID=3346430 RepID=UPI0036EE70D8